MRRNFLLLVCFLCASTIYGRAQVLDSLLLYRNIFDMLQVAGPLGNRVNLVQPSSLKHAVEDLTVKNGAKKAKIQGYRIRIFSSNQQTARQNSETVQEEFQQLYPNVPAYRKFENLDYRVTVGDFRTRSEAMRFWVELTGLAQYKAAVIVKDAIEYPVL